MSRARRKEGPCAPLFIPALVFFVGGSVYAQTVDLAELESCVELPTEHLQLACFQSIVAKGKEVEPSSDESTASPLKRAGEPFDTALGEDSRANSTVDVLTSTNVDDGESTIDEFSSVSQIDPGESPIAGAATEQAAGAELGEEYLAKSERRDENGELVAVVATVNEVSRERGRKLTFHFSNGQVWRQMEQGYIQYPKDGEFVVEITRGMMGDYRLRVDAKGRMTRIVRIQ